MSLFLQESMVTNVQNAISNFDFAYDTNGKKKFFANNISVLIDVSGSTKEEKNGEQIIISEVKGVICAIYQIMEKYDLTNCNFDFIVFGSYAKKIWNFVGKSNEEISEELLNLPEYIKYMFSLTNLKEALSLVIDDMKDKTHIIIAIDGNPNGGGSCEEIIEYMEEIPEEKHKLITMNVIGFGEINDWSGGNDSFVSTMVKEKEIAKYFVNNNKETSENLHQLKAKYSNENDCNMGFLLELIGEISVASYCPFISSDDGMKVLKNNLDMFFENTNKTLQEKPKIIQKEVLPAQKYKIHLDNLVIDMQDNIANILQEKKSAIAYISGARNWYFYTEQWQVAVTGGAVGKLDSNKIYNCNEPLIYKSYSDTYILKDATDILTTTGETIKPLLDTNGYWRCRKVEKY